jgi:putative DNA methylase
VRKKLIEVSIPLEAINKESAREKSIRHGHPSTLHLWWARRPLAACRAVLFAQLVDDPGSCTEEFTTPEAQKAERDRLHDLIKRLVPWEASTNETILNEARYEIARSVARERGEKLPPLNQMRPQEIIDYLQANAPPVYDPFSGGASIPLEAQRLGLRAMGSDLNPVAVLIGKALVEIPPKFAGRKPVNPETNELIPYRGAQGLADDVRYYGRWMREQAIKKIGHLYPRVKLKDGSEATVIAWLWARTVSSPDPKAKGGHVPLASSFVLSANVGKEVIVKPVVDRANMVWCLEVKEKPTKEELAAAKDGTKSARATFACLLTGTPIGGDYIDREAAAGRMSEKLMAVVAEGKAGRIYVAPTSEHMAATDAAAKVILDHGHEMDLPLQQCRGTFASNAQGRRYKFKTFADYFTPRQLVALTAFSDLVGQARAQVLADAEAHWSGPGANDPSSLAEGGLGPTAYADAVATYLAFLVSRLADRSSSICSWDLREGQGRKEGIRNVFSRQAIQMTWDFAEANPLSDIAASFETAIMRVADVLLRVPAIGSGTVANADAAKNSFSSSTVFATDPPYYDNIGYADLSDFFYVWLRRSLSSVHPDLFRRMVTPKREELVATPYRHDSKQKAEAFFLDGMKGALAGIAKASADMLATIYYAFKQSELSEEGVTSAGWATFLQAVTDSGLVVDGTWPVRSELSNRMIASGTNALASSIVLVCRRRDPAAATVTRADFMRALRREMPEALAEIRRAGVGPTDIQQAAIGPGIGIFTRYAQVLNADGTSMPVKDALKLINQVREEITAPAAGDYDNATLFALDWFTAHEFKKGSSGVAINMTNAVNISIDGMNEAGFFMARGGEARLLKRAELPAAWDPAKNSNATVWEACQHLIKRHTAEDGGIEAAARLYNRLGSLAEPARALARRLYDICEQKQWHGEANFYNQLYLEWPAIEKRAAELASERDDLFAR